MIEWRHAAEGLTRLLWDPFDFLGAMVFFDGFADTRAVRAAYARMLRDLSAAERDRLRALTLAPLDVPRSSRCPRGRWGAPTAASSRRTG